MPIHINLLAEAQALEEQRRRDPVKFVILGGVAVVVLILVYSSSLLVQTMIAKGSVNRLESSLNSRTNQYRQILENQRMLADDQQRLEALHQLATNRFLVGSLLGVLEKTTVPNVQLVKLNLDQKYIVTPEVKAKRHGVKPKPATATEKILLTLSAKDFSSTPGDGVNKYQQALSRTPYFEDQLRKSTGFRLASLGAPQSGPGGGSFVLFALEARFPDRKR